MCTAALQKNLPDFMTNLQGTSVTVPGVAGRKPGAADVPLGDGMLDSARQSILSRREKIRRAVEGSQ